ncbi:MULTISPECIES: cupin domain-containing protein [Paraburkholderia]|uniref:HTH-type transcriptional regulator PuuR n=2 Tax=Paraburkholderia TaxID=1822464 RepID=A0A6J5FKV7_9BURK|nr:MULTISPECIES: cupin domain-containing protein [Paraburkholderia]GGC64769.1 aldehyde dehydrogenase [Paraburkholderia caffeinilytica]CAB3782058.1 HTH-type transcriptional regulator PuuR [Paraburkholderia caffeinitolerans]CAB3802620.1 HTH-type transcriptional regulator PuuR [Paraburkholderia caffeinilytica]
MQQAAVPRDAEERTSKAKARDSGGAKRKVITANTIPNIERAPVDEPSSDDLNIGNRLRELRIKHGLSIRALAEVAGLTHSTIGQIEANKTSPSVGSMKRILDALRIPMSQFFADAEAQTEEQIFFGKDELIELADGKSLSYRQIGKNLSGKAIMMLTECYAPGADTGEPYSHQAEECGVVISGKLMIVVGGRERCLSKGEAYYFDSRIPHRMFNPFDEVCEVISAVSPPTF